ncbi:MAG: pentapeptide repeat-containing protein [Cyanobacteria bacterium P01_G01_bin.39]
MVDVLVELILNLWEHTSQKNVKRNFCLGNNEQNTDPDSHYNAKLNSNNFAGMSLKFHKFPFASLDGANFSDADLTAANFFRASLIGASFSQAELCRTYMCFANLSDVKLEGAKITRTDFHKAMMESINGSGLSFIDCDFGYASLSKANLTKAQCPGGNFFRASLQEASLTGTDLTNCDLRVSNLIKADLSNANICGANLEGATLQGSNLTNIKFDDSTNFGKDQTVYIPQGQEISPDLTEENLQKCLQDLYENQSSNSIMPIEKRTIFRFTGAVLDPKTAFYFESKGFCLDFIDSSSLKDYQLFKEQMESGDYSR